MHGARVYQVLWDTPYAGMRQGFLVQLDDGRYGYMEKLEAKFADG